MNRTDDLIADSTKFPALQNPSRVEGLFGFSSTTNPSFFAMAIKRGLDF